jgi:hypothetical protein
MPCPSREIRFTPKTLSFIPGFVLYSLPLHNPHSVLSFNIDPDHLHFPDYLPKWLLEANRKHWQEAGRWEEGRGQDLVLFLLGAMPLTLATVPGFQLPLGYWLHLDGLVVECQLPAPGVNTVNGWNCTMSYLSPLHLTLIASSSSLLCQHFQSPYN